MVQKYNYTFSCLTNNDDISYYLLGVFMAKGTVYGDDVKHSCQITSNDKGWLDSIKNVLGTNLQVSYLTNGSYGIRIIRNDPCIWLINNGCAPNKELILEMPKIPQQFVSDFFRGLCDSIGNFNKNETNISFYMTFKSKKLVNSLINYLDSININSYAFEENKEEEHHRQSYSLVITQWEVYKLCKFIYNDNNKLRRHTQYLKSQNIINYYENEYFEHRKQVAQNQLNTRTKITWPTNDKLIKLILKYGYEKLAIKLKVHPSAIRLYMHRRNLYTIVKQKLKDKRLKRINKKNFSRKELGKKISISIWDTIKYKNYYNNKNSNNLILSKLLWTIEEFKIHIESLFSHPNNLTRDGTVWMTWDNHGQYLPKLWNDNDISTWVWNLDHIIPHSKFNYSSLTDQECIDCWSLSNLRPYNGELNILEGTKRTRH